MKGWDGEHHNIVQLNDVQDLAVFIHLPRKHSNWCCKVIPIKRHKDLYIINVELFNDMTNLRHVHVIENLDFTTLNSLNPSNE